MGQRPAHVRPPAYLSPNSPVPVPDAAPQRRAPGGELPERDPTRYGDWERKGVAVDF